MKQHHQRSENALHKEGITTTEFGKALRKMRIEKDENMAAMAEKMEISLSYLSAIETGTRAVPDGFVEKLSRKYKLRKKSTDELLTALDHSVSSVDISLVGALPLQRDLAVMLARKLPDLSEDDCVKMLSILKEGD